VHRHVSGWILCLWGNMRWRVGEKTREVCGPLRRREHGGLGLAAASVPADIEHGAEVLGRRGVFLNFERLTADVISPAYDFETV